MAAAGRRQFLRDAAVLVAGTLAALSGAPVAAAALEPMVIAGVGDGPTKSYPIPDTDSVNIDRDEGVIIARWHDELFAFSLACPHQRTALRWETDNQQFRCPKHHSRFTAEGVLIDGRAKRSMDRFGVTRDGDSLVVNFDQFYRQDDNPDLWKAALIRL